MTRDFFSIGTAIGLLATALFSPAKAADESYLLACKTLPPGTELDWGVITEVDTHLKVLSDGKEFPSDYRSKTDVLCIYKVISPTKATGDIYRVTGKPLSAEIGVRPILTMGTQYIFEKEEPGWSIRNSSGAPVGSDEKNELRGVNPAAIARYDTLIFGTTPRRPGDQWEVKIDKISEFASLTNPTGTISVKFVEIRFGHTKCAVIEMHVDLEGTSTSGLKTHLKSDIEERRSLAGGFIENSTTESTMEYSSNPDSDEKVTGTGKMTTHVSYTNHPPR